MSLCQASHWCGLSRWADNNIDPIEFDAYSLKHVQSVGHHDKDAAISKLRVGAIRPPPLGRTLGRLYLCVKIQLRVLL